MQHIMSELTFQILFYLDLLFSLLMGNITDIPPEYLKPQNKSIFLQFLTLLPITNRRRIEIIAEWQQFTGLKISSEEASQHNIFYNV